MSTNIIAESGEAYFIEASTGCTCCSNENFIQGPYRALSRALEQAQSFEKRRHLASQYASRGIYGLRKASYERLLDGRLILGGKLIAADFLDRETDPEADPGEYVYQDPELGHPDRLPFSLQEIAGQADIGGYDYR